jgi:hypothetical protein
VNPPGAGAVATTVSARSGFDGVVAGADGLSENSFCPCGTCHTPAFAKSFFLYPGLTGAEDFSFETFAFSSAKPLIGCVTTYGVA